MKFESPEEQNPIFEAKGIETVRRDQCALTQKILRNALITTFRNGIVAAREYLNRQWALIHAGRLPVSDFILTGRVRSRYRGGKIGPVQAVLSRRLAEADPGRVVRHKERIPYVIVATPGLNFRLRDCVLTPNELLEQWDSYTIHSVYYVTKHVNASLQRCLGLAPYNVDVNAWYEACPKPRKRIHHWPVTRSGGNAMIYAYFGSDICSICAVKCQANGSARAVVCATCRYDKIGSALLALNRLNDSQQKANRAAIVCRDCNGFPENSGTFAQEKLLQAGTEKGKSNIGGVLVSSHLGKNRKSIGNGIKIPIANCICIDCPLTYERHKLREAELEAIALCNALEIF